MRAFRALRSSPPKLSHRHLSTKLSYFSGPKEPVLLHQTVGSHLADITALHGDRTAVVSYHQKSRLTYEELHARSTELAHGLARYGVKKGDRVAVSLGNGIEYAVATYALFKLGAVLVPLNTNFNSNQITAAINHLDVSHLIISTEANLPRKAPRSNIPILTELVPNLANGSASEILPSLKGIIAVDNSAGRFNGEYKGLDWYNDLAADGASVRKPLVAELDPDEVVNIQFTSGTTSVPKAACLTHTSILNNGKSIGDRMLLTENDSICCPPPFFHCFGCVLGYLACMTHGSAIVLPAESFNAEATVFAVRDEKCTGLHGVPTMFIQILELLEEGVVNADAFKYLRTGIAAGSSVPSELMKKLHQKLNLTELTICYGMTETAPVSCMTTTNDPLIKRLDSVGRLLPHVEAKVVDPLDKSRIIPIGEKGELAVTGYNLMTGYWNDVERTAEAMIADKEGKVWMHTGDEAEMDEAGYVKITGRIKELIIRGGENIHPLEIENCLLAHPEIAEVSVVGLKDAKYGEVVAAFVRMADHHEGLTEDKVRLWVREKLSSHLVPAYIFWTTDFPKTASGKIQKFKLQELGNELRAASDAAKSASP
ncbi:acetyl-CoA synthetase-like protein [Ascodesmis nigricans]|uniref:Acetyl-CoA synthetase-like protein n=1 Tax=Ascodesmis nigricans TaxID=341454 RepID=A0A4S2N243_9PEZI|nr:acetyl-CoA synthetase-like protein [Ascodesmis nigricans]